MKGIIVFAALGLFVMADTAAAQAPPVGPGHCVGNCGGGSYGHGGGGGGGGGGRGAAIGSAIGLGVAVGTAIIQQQMQQQQQRNQSEERSRRAKRKPTKGDDEGKRTAKRDDGGPKRGNPPAKTDKPDQPPQKSVPDNSASKSQEAKQSPAKTAKTTVPPVNPGHCVPTPQYPCPTGGTPPSTTTASSGSGWSDCTSRGGVWGNSGCGHPNAMLQLLPYFVPLESLLQHPDKLPCPSGYQESGETFYGGTKCAPGGGDSSSSLSQGDIAPSFVDSQQSQQKKESEPQPKSELNEQEAMAKTVMVVLNALDNILNSDDQREEEKQEEEEKLMQMRRDAYDKVFNDPDASNWSRVLPGPSRP